MKRNWHNRSRRSHNHANGGGKSNGGSSANWLYESVGPEVKLRGKAEQVYRKYQDLARDAQLSGDGVRAEALLQHGEHYYRMMDETSLQRVQQADATDNNDMASNGSAPLQGEATKAEALGYGTENGIEKTQTNTNGARVSPAVPISEVQTGHTATASDGKDKLISDEAGLLAPDLPQADSPTAPLGESSAGKKPTHTRRRGLLSETPDDD